MHLARRLSSRTARGWILLLFSCSFLLYCNQQAMPQSMQGGIIGTVKDTTGAIVPEAPITLTNVGEGTTRTTKSNAQGDYAFLDVKAGRYSVEIRQPGF